MLSSVAAQLVERRLERYGKSVAQVVLRRLIQRDVVVIPQVRSP